MSRRAPLPVIPGALQHEVLLRRPGTHAALDADLLRISRLVRRFGFLAVIAAGRHLATPDVHRRA